MTNSNTVPELARRITAVVRQVIGEIRPQLIDAALTGRRAENENLRHSDNFLSDYDLWMHERYKEVLVEHIPSFVYASEEADPEVVGDESDPDLCVLVDPLDTSELAVRGLYGYTHIMITRAPWLDLSLRWWEIFSIMSRYIWLPGKMEAMIEHWP